VPSVAASVSDWPQSTVNHALKRKDGDPVDKETIALVIAQNGLGTACAILNAKAVKLKKLADKGGPDAVKLAKQAKNAEKLATALRIA
jgi:hypothetical protein